MSGGSAFGLDASGGVMKYLREKGIGYHTDIINVPIVCQAVLYDLQMLDQSSKPIPTNSNSTTETVNNTHNSCSSIELPNYFELGYKACTNQYKSIDVNGNIGAGNGAVIGKILGKEHAMKGGLGTFAIQLDDLKVGAIVAVNCFGDICESGKIIAGCYSEILLDSDERDEISVSRFQFLDSEKVLFDEYLKSKKETNVFEASSSRAMTNTTIGIIVTNGILDKSQLNRIAKMAHDGYARSMRPSHTLYDGDTIFVISTNTIDVKPPTNLVGTLAAQVIEKAVINGVKSAQSLSGYKSFNDLNQNINF